jgi:hypothetical protein
MLYEGRKQLVGSELYCSKNAKVFQFNPEWVWVTNSCQDWNEPFSVAYRRKQSGGYEGRAARCSSPAQEPDGVRR